MSKRFYIEETKSDWSGMEQKIVEQAFYGPFEESEMTERVNDAFADYMAEGGAEIDGIVMTDDEANKHYINPRAFWMSQLATLTDIQETKSA